MKKEQKKETTVERKQGFVHYGRKKGPSPNL